MFSFGSRWRGKRLRREAARARRRGVDVVGDDDDGADGVVVGVVVVRRSLCLTQSKTALVAWVRLKRERVVDGIVPCVY